MGLHENCDGNLPEGLCVFANVCGYISNVIWFLVLLPQLLKNFRRRSTDGLSFLWASCNFTASLINLFFILQIQVPLFTRISGWYMPILEAGMLLQFLVYSEASLHRKALLTVLSLSVYSALIAMETVKVFGGGGETSSKMVWISIVLWSVETYFQVVLNMQRRSVEGQSYISLALSFVGKTTDVIMQFSLLMPTQYVYMTYFSSTLAYFNFMQLVIYTQPKRISHPVTVLLSLLLAGFAALLVLRTSAVSLVCPLGVLILLAGALVVTRQRRQRNQPRELEEEEVGGHPDDMK
ncbi:hypothetical protein EMPS_00827 [Entomortierella parvispora]|uniref:Uncharacterized protein n=1 Tax=Entomortierella parvispora TaxID=205924 RepID=A0A9P3H1P4_9FUNG|nr:hypothetical protein EMPS_00827 [Entomortierella parvispora]